MEPKNIIYWLLPRVGYSLMPLGEKLTDVLWEHNDWRKLLLGQSAEKSGHII